MAGGVARLGQHLPLLHHHLAIPIARTVSRMQSASLLRRAGTCAQAVAIGGRTNARLPVRSVVAGFLLVLQAGSLLNHLHLHQTQHPLPVSAAGEEVALVEHVCARKPRLGMGALDSLLEVRTSVAKALVAPTLTFQLAEGLAQEEVQVVQALVIQDSTAFQKMVDSSSPSKKSRLLGRHHTVRLRTSSSAMESHTKSAGRARL